MKPFVQTLIAIAMLAPTSQAWAVLPYAATPLEIAQMPDYCKVKMAGGSQAEQQKWSARFGPLWGDMHHFCHGLKFVQRASVPGISPQDRNYNLTTSIGEFDYVLRSKNAAGGHWFLPEIHMQKSAVYSRLGRHAEAAAEMKNAREKTRR